MEIMEKPLIKKMRENYQYFGGMSLLYGLIFAFCLYKNVNGITFIIYTASTIAFALLFMKKIEFKLQKKSKRYFIGMILLSIAMVLTNEIFFIFFNWLGILLLFGVGMIHQFYNDAEWNFPSYLKRLFILFGTSIVCIFYPFMHGVNYLSQRNQGKRKTLLSILIGILVALGLLCIILPLLLNSDMVFAKLFGDVLKYINFSTIMGVGFTFIIGFAVCYAFFASLAAYNLPAEADRKMKHFSSVIGITFNSVIAFVYLIYCGVQILYLFIGFDKGLPAATTYSEYARSGFWELLFVSVINFILVLVCMYLFSDNNVLKGILTVISGCTYIMLVSAAYRMVLYIDQYHLTFLRVLVLWFLLVLALIMGGVIITIYRKSFPLFRYITTIVAICYISFALCRPNYWIVQYNVAYSEEMTYRDLKYLMIGYSENAASAIAKMDPEDISVNGEDYTTNNVKGQLYNYFMRISLNNKDVYFRKANYVRIRAKNIADKYLEEHKDYKKYSDYNNYSSDYYENL